MMTLKPGRSSIFEAFFESANKDESQSSSQLGSNGSLSSFSSMLGRAPSENADLVGLTDEYEYDVQQEPTLWMSCSPGRDSSDNEADSRTLDFGDAKRDDDDDDDDELPASQVTGRREFKTTGCLSSDGQSLDGESSMKCNAESKMPVSGYALFYNDAKAAIVGGNPNVKFAKIANVVASMWDQLDDVSKEEESRCPDMQVKARVRRVAKHSPDQNELQQMRKHEQSCSKKFHRMKKLSNGNGAKTKEVDLTVLCRRPDCLDIAVDNPRWSNDYCSSRCIVTHCKDVFNAWVAERRETFKISESLTD